MEPWLEILKTFGLPLGMLLVALIGGHRGWWVYGTHHRELISLLREHHLTTVTSLQTQLEASNKRAGDMEQRLLRSLGTTEAAVTVAASQVRLTDGG